MLDLLQSLASFNPQQNYALAIVMHTEGSTYRKPGALMLLDESLNYWGLVSGGCLESDIQQNAGKVFTSLSDMSLEYDMRGDEDLMWGMGSGCNGAVKLLIKFLDAKDNHQGFFEVMRAVEAGNCFLMRVESSLDRVLIFNKLTRQNNTLKAQWNTESRQLSIPLIAPLRLLICGASPDVSPVTEMAKALGWKSTVIDHRADFALVEKFPMADQVAHIKRSEWSEFALGEYDAAVIMSHQFERDLAYLKKLLESNIHYIGLLGPSKRRDMLLAECGTDFSAQEGRLFAPIGLDIGADTPQTIALAIVAEIQAVRAQKKIGFCYQDTTR